MSGSVGFERIFDKKVKNVLKGRKGHFYPLQHRFLTTSTQYCIIHVPRHEKTYLRESPTRSDSNWPAQLQKLTRVLKFRLYNLEILYYLSSEQQRRWSDCTDAQSDLRLCCSHMTWDTFSHGPAHMKKCWMWFISKTQTKHTLGYSACLDFTLNFIA